LSEAYYTSRTKVKGQGHMGVFLVCMILLEPVDLDSS